MPKKKSAKSATRSSKSHGELFDKHPHLKWLIPVFFVVAAIALYFMKMDSDSGMINYSETVEEIEVVVPDANVTEDANTTNSTDASSDTMPY